jgi:hypothetical protein
MMRGRVMALYLAIFKGPRRAGYGRADFPDQPGSGRKLLLEPPLVCRPPGPTETRIVSPVFKLSSSQSGSPRRMLARRPGARRAHRQSPDQAHDEPPQRSRFTRDKHYQTGVRSDGRELLASPRPVGVWGSVDVQPLDRVVLRRLGVRRGGVGRPGSRQ